VIITAWVGCAGDDVVNLSQVFNAYAKILKDPGFLKQKGITDPVVAGKFIYSVKSPVPVLVTVVHAMAQFLLKP
jgi:hypothetical protein